MNTPLSNPALPFIDRRTPNDWNSSRLQDCKTGLQDLHSSFYYSYWYKIWWMCFHIVIHDSAWKYGLPIMEWNKWKIGCVTRSEWALPNVLSTLEFLQYKITSSKVHPFHAKLHVESTIFNVWFWLVQPWNGCLNQPWNGWLSQP